MNVRHVATLLVRVLAVLVLVVSSAYLLVYLYRWEWNRALVSGVFVLAAELAVIGGAVSRRLVDVQRQLDRHVEHDRQRRIEERLAAAPAPRHVSFAWLHEASDGLGVFVPVLLGAGAVLSALAYVVERVAVVTADPLVQRDLAARLGALQLPPGGFLPGTASPAIGRDADLSVLRPVPRGRRAFAWAIVAITTAVLVAGLIAALANVTQARDEPDRSTQTTAITLEVHDRGDVASASASFDLLWGVCRTQLDPAVRVASVRTLGPSTLDVTLDHGLGRTSARKFGGCLEDALLDRVQASITRMITVTGDPDRPLIDPRWDTPPEG